MTNREKVIKAIEHCKADPNCSACDDCKYGGRSTVVCENLLTDILELLKKQPQWINVKDRQPKQSGCYLVYRPNFWGAYGGQTCVCYWDGKYWCDSYEGAGADGFELSPGDVTYWMPLPKPPEGVRQDEID